MSENNEHRLTTRDEVTDFLLYTAPDGAVKVECVLHDETIWLTQKRIANLFGIGVPAISKHLDNIYASGELERRATLSILETVQKEGTRQVKRKIEFYNLDAIISVGYRVNSSKATQFRIWATQLLREYITKGFADSELLEESVIRNFRITTADGKNYNTKHYNLAAIIAIGYKVNSERAVQFCKWATTIIQEFAVKDCAIHGQTAAEVFLDCADRTNEKMGLTHWDGAPIRNWR
jgi:hypothetical protein